MATTTEHESILRRLPPDVRAMALGEAQAQIAKTLAAADAAGIEKSDAQLIAATGAAMSAILAPFAAAADEADLLFGASHDAAITLGLSPEEREAAGARVRGIFWEEWQQERAAVSDEDVWNVPEPTGPRYYAIEGAEGARLIRDALARYLADKPVETLRVLVTLLRTLPHGYAPRIDLGGSEEAGGPYALVSSLPKALTGVTRSVNGGPIHYALAEIDEVEIAARYTPKDEP